MNISHVAVYKIISNDLQKNELKKLEDHVSNDLIEQRSKKGFKDLIYLEKDLQIWHDVVVVQKKTVNEVVRNLPEKEKKVFKSYGIQGLLYVPIFFEEKVWGSLQIFDHESEKLWSCQEIEILHLFGEMIANRVEYKILAAMEVSNMKESECLNLDIKQTLKDLSHQIKSPLSIIELNLSMLLSFKSQIQKQDVKKFQNKMDRLDRAVAEMKKLVESLDFIKLNDWVSETKK